MRCKFRGAATKSAATKSAAAKSAATKVAAAKSAAATAPHSPLILLRLRTRITVHALTAAGQKSNGNSGAWISQICGELRDVFIRTLSPIQRVQDQGSKIPCVKFGAMKRTYFDKGITERVFYDGATLPSLDEQASLLYKACL